MKSDKFTLMAHLVAGYPDLDASRAAARGLVEGGASYLEVQIPFSDPNADGPSIMNACSTALSNGFTVANAFDLITSLRLDYPSIPIFVMAYASLVATPGPAAFTQTCSGIGVSGLIVPDLPFDADEGLSEACAEHQLACVPVAAPSMNAARLDKMIALERPYIYSALRVGITGAATKFDEPSRLFLEKVASRGTKILGGFGIRSGIQVSAVAPYVHAVVAGSVFIDAIAEVIKAQQANRRRGYRGSPRVRDEAIRRTLRQKAEELCGIVR